MPGYVMHLAVAERVIELCNITDSEYINSFKLGNIIPDAVSRESKKKSHFWDDETYKKFVRKPNLRMFLEKYGSSNDSRLDDPYVFGYYCHLLLDCRFIDEYWQKHFKFYDDNMNEAVGFDETTKVMVIDNQTQIQNQTVYDRNEFFSDKYYYGDYNRMNQYILDRYKIQVPGVEAQSTSIVKVNDSTKILEIDEIKISDVAPELNKMLEFVKTSNIKNTNDSQSAIVILPPKLTVFNLTDLTTLIETTAQHLSSYYKARVQFDCP